MVPPKCPVGISTVHRRGRARAPRNRGDFELPLGFSGLRLVAGGRKACREGALLSSERAHVYGDYLRLEPLGVELVAAAARDAGHRVRIIDLQVSSRQDFLRILDEWQPDAVAFGLNYLANIPEVVDLAKQTRERLPRVLFFVGGHSASFTARDILEHAGGAIDCVVKGEGEDITPRLLAAARDDRSQLHTLPGVVIGAAVATRK